ncbi:hypothetical protein CB1_000968005 [Camelus ferus]|nr:hypothetical protein CB1_000968005 [Camelus ferus]
MGDFDAVGATTHGRAAHFINHPYEPNGFSQVIHVGGQKHMVIFALHHVLCGEELICDHRVPIEDASTKLSCNCGTKSCLTSLTEPWLSAMPPAAILLLVWGLPGPSQST